MKMLKRVIMLIMCMAICFSCCAVQAKEITADPMVGDANGDGKVNLLDIITVRKSLVSLYVKINSSNADIDSDGKTTVLDLLLLRKGLVGLVKLDDYMYGTPSDLLASNLKKVGNRMTSPISGDEYTLKWIDDFSGNTLNETNWKYLTKNCNQMEESVNRKENVTVSGGSLYLAAKKEDKTYTGDADPWNTPKVSNLTSACISSEGKQSFQYGRFEIKCKIPYSYGMWAAFWTCGTKRGWPWGGEIDIMEFVGGTAWGTNRDSQYNSGLHWSDPDLPSSLAWGTNKTVGVLDTDEGTLPAETKMTCGDIFRMSTPGKLNDEWHICGMEWTDKTMKFYCDDEVYLTIDITRSSMREAFHQPHHIILDLVMGGGWAGTPNENTVFPQYLQIDWVKVWQK